MGPKYSFKKCNAASMVKTWWNCSGKWFDHTAKFHFVSNQLQHGMTNTRSDNYDLTFAIFIFFQQYFSSKSSLFWWFTMPSRAANALLWPWGRHLGKVVGKPWWSRLTKKKLVKTTKKRWFGLLNLTLVPDLWTKMNELCVRFFWKWILRKPSKLYARYPSLKKLHLITETV